MRTLVAAVLVAVGLAAGGGTARADELIDSGPGYSVFRHDPNAGGAVYVRYDYDLDTGPGVLTTLLGVEPAPGWSDRVYEAGGLDARVDIRFESRTHRLKFKVLVVPGRTVIDYGELKKK
ncbi:MAG: hypothetical protein K2X87_04655 [Gemmataceae bacterium]|nr:hypothetical protein [Gemmataceae bacterium]